MTDDGLEFVLDYGNELRLQYYDGRAHDIDEDHRQALAQAVIDASLDGTTTRPAIINSLLLKKKRMSSSSKHLNKGFLINASGALRDPYSLLGQMACW